MVPTTWVIRPTHWATFDAGTIPYAVFTGLGLPTLEECSHRDWEAAGQLCNPVVNATLPSQIPLTPAAGPYDAWSNPHPYDELDQTTGAMLRYAASVSESAVPPYPMPRVGEDAVLNNVVGFDVKVWDPQVWVLPAIDAAGDQTDLVTLGNYWNAASFTNDDVIPGAAVVPGDPGYELALAHALHAVDTVPANPALDRFLPVGYGAYVDLNYMASMNINGSLGSPSMADLKLRLLSLTPFAGPGDTRSQLQRVYDTWSTHYESNWLDSNLDGVKAVALLPDPPDQGDEDYDGLFDEGTDGIDNDDNGLVDDAGEQEAPPPYPVPLRGIQIKIRVFDPDSRQVRERTVVCDFLPK
jgi:hypothetical protein